VNTWRVSSWSISRLEVMDEISESIIMDEISENIEEALRGFWSFSIKRGSINYRSSPLRSTWFDNTGVCSFRTLKKKLLTDARKGSYMIPVEKTPGLSHGRIQATAYERGHGI